MCTNDSNSGRGSKTSSPLCLPSNKRRRRDECALGTYQITTGESSYTCVLHDLSGVLFPKMDIDLRGVQVRVSEPLLQLIRRNPLLGLIRCECMPESMTGGLLG